MARKKIVFVIVEGMSDEVALGVALSSIYDKDSVYVHIMHGDITSRNGVNGGNVVAKVGDEIRAFAKANHYVKGDFKQIIHIVDMDGAYIPDEIVFEDEGLERVLYEDDGIHAPNASSIVSRNKRKRENLERLMVRGDIWGVPYRVYYMSCNLDHVLHDKRNSTEEEKEEDAYRFARRYKDDIDGFVKFICESDFSVSGNYKETWSYIEEDLHSLERNSNLGLCIRAAKDKGSVIMV